MVPGPRSSRKGVLLHTTSGPGRPWPRLTAASLCSPMVSAVVLHHDRRGRPRRPDQQNVVRPDRAEIEHGLGVPLTKLRCRARASVASPASSRCRATPRSITALPAACPGSPTNNVVSTAGIFWSRTSRSVSLRCARSARSPDRSQARRPNCSDTRTCSTSGLECCRASPTIAANSARLFGGGSLSTDNAENTPPTISSMVSSASYST
jgi:hypothetical protein